MTVTNYLATAEVPTFFRVLGVPDTNLAVGLVGYYPFNGNANDLSGLGNVVTVSGAVLSPDRFGVTNRAYRFDGINDIMTWPESTSSNWFYGRTNLALAFWIKPLQVESSKRIFIEYGTSYFGLEGTTGPGGSVEFCANNDFATTVLTNTIEVAVWNHFVLQVTGTKKELYKNGRLVGQVAYSDPIIPNFVNHTFRMGGRGDAPHWSNSCYDDLRIYNRSLSSNEVWRLYNLPY